jgi:threonine dehydratase
MVAVSARLVAIGGGEVARDELLAAKALGRPVTFIAADMNHVAAVKKAAARGQPLPTDFRGAAHEAVAGISRSPR